MTERKVIMHKDDLFYNILVARNRTRRQHKVYLYEAQKSMLKDISKCLPKASVSDVLCIMSLCFLEQTGHDMSWVPDRDLFKMKELRRAIATKK